MDQSPNQTITQSLNRIPVAVIGVGEHGKKHAKEFQQVPGAELVGVYDLRADRKIGRAHV